MSEVRKLTTFYLGKNDPRWVTLISLKTITDGSAAVWQLRSAADRDLLSVGLGDVLRAHLRSNILQHLSRGVIHRHPSVFNSFALLHLLRSCGTFAIKLSKKGSDTVS